MPAFSLLSAPPSLTLGLQCTDNAPLPFPMLDRKAAASVVDFSPVTFSARGPSTSELLRTL